MRKINKFFRASGLERRLFCEAVFWCTVARLMMLVLPFQRYASLLGNPRNETTHKPESHRRVLLEQISTAIRRGSRYVPWKTKCFVEAIAARVMLKRRNIKSTIYLGAAKENGKMIAHAWLRSGDIILTGKRGMGKYTIVSTFGE
jgi:hypothetical protein